MSDSVPQAPAGSTCSCARAASRPACRSISSAGSPNHPTSRCTVHTEIRPLARRSCSRRACRVSSPWRRAIRQHQARGLGRGRRLDCGGIRAPASPVLAPRPPCPTRREAGRWTRARRGVMMAVGDIVPGVSLHGDSHSIRQARPRFPTSCREGSADARRARSPARARCTGRPCRDGPCSPWSGRGPGRP